MVEDRQLDLLFSIDRAHGLTPSVSAVTVSQLFDAWAKLRQFTKSWKAEQGRFSHIVRLLGTRSAVSVDETAWAEYVASRMRESAPSAATLYLELVRAKQLLRWASRAGMIPRNPLDGVRSAREPRKRETWLTWDQVERMLRASDERPFVHAWILVAVTSGMRVSETLTLRHDRIGKDGVVTIASAQTKSGRKRIVALPARTLEAIAELPRHMSSPFVFWSGRNGRSVHRTTIRRWFRAVAEKCGIDAVVADGDSLLRCHDMRHTCASLLDAAGAQPTDIRDQLGHMKLGTTERYLHRRQASRALDMAGLMDRGLLRRGPAKSTWDKSESLTVKRGRGIS